MDTRERIILACVECLRHNYSITKNKQKQPLRVEYKKFCATCNKHTVHKETR